MDKESIFNQNWEKKKLDSVGFGLSDKGIIKFKMGEIPLKGMFCSADNDYENFEENILYIDCDTTVFGNPYFDCN